MKARRLILILALPCIAAGFLVAWRSVEHRRHAEENLRLARTARQAAESAQRAASARVTTAQEQLAKVSADLAQVRAKAKPVPTAAPVGKSPPGFSPMAAINQDPKLQNMFLAAERARLGPTYGPLFRQLGWTPERAEKFSDIIVKRAEKNMDIMAVAQAQGLRPDDPALTALSEQGEVEIDAAAAAALTPAEFQQWQEYERTVGVRGVVQNFVGAAAVEGMPLSAAQAEQFALILAGASASYQKGGKANYVGLDWASVELGLKSVFSEPQLELYRQIEPIGGGASRFGAMLTTTFNAAIRAEKARQSAARPPGG